MNYLLFYSTVTSSLCFLFFLFWLCINRSKNRPYKKLIKWTIISALIFIASMIGINAEINRIIIVESIELSLADNQESYDINTEIPVNITVLPENASINSLEYISSSDSLSFSDTGIFTGAKEGTFNVYVKTETVMSNILSINVVDYTAREEAKQEAIQRRLAEEQAAKEVEEKRLAEEQRLAEEKAAKEAEEKRLSEEQAAKEAEEKRLAEEQAAKEAEEKAAKEAEQQKLAEEQAAKEAEQQRLAEEQAAKEAEQATLAQAQAPQPSAPQSSDTSSSDGSNFNTYDNESQQETSASYVLNTSTMKIHHPSCKSVKKIAPQNYATSNSSVEELIGQGYSTCGNCFK